MRRFPVLFSAAVLVLVGLALAGSLLVGTAAQDATPAADGSSPEGVTFEPLALAPALALPNPGDLVLVRIGLEPGAALPSDPADPSFGMVLVEAGELTVRIDGPVVITRAGSFGAAGATAEAGGAFAAPEEAVAAGEAATLRPGDVGLFPPNAGGELRNDGAAPAALLAFLVAPAGGEAGAAPPAAATPAS